MDKPQDRFLDRMDKPWIEKTPFYPIFSHAKLLILHYIYTVLDRMDRFLYIITREKKKIIMIIRKKIIYIYIIYIVIFIHFIHLKQKIVIIQWFKWLKCWINCWIELS